MSNSESVINPEESSTDVWQEQGWVEAEWKDVQLGDRRLNWRLQDTAAKLAARPTGSINQACDEWADSKATYRLFANQKVTDKKILAPHFARSTERLKGYAVVLAVQDTTYLDYTQHPKKEGLGPIGTAQQKLQGMVMHTTLFTTLTGLPLGLASQDIWIRDEKAKPLTDSQRQQLPIAQKESNKWLTALTHTVKLLPDGTQAVTVGDSESDIFELFKHAESLKTDLLVRAAQDRSIANAEESRLWAHMQSRSIRGYFQIEVPERNNEPKRSTVVSVRFNRITLKPPQHLRSQYTSMTLYAVLVREDEPPKAGTAVEWLLLTTVAVHSLEDALQRIQWYRQRWQIEVYHKVLKSGCQVEKTQLAKLERLLPFIALFCVIAWRLFWMTHIARHEPDAPCTLILADHEWHALYAHTHRSTRLPQHIPTVHQVVRWIAQLGGFLARKSDGHPGPTVIWRGWQRLQDISHTWLLLHPLPTCG